MTTDSIRALSMPFQVPLLTLLLLALAATTVLSSKSEALMPRPAYAIAGASGADATPYGSGAALRNLLF